MRSRNLASAITIVLLVTGCGASAPPSPAPSESPSSSPPAQSVGPSLQTGPSLSPEPSIGPASWWVDPETLPLSASTRTIRAIVREVACASGQSPEGRILPPMVTHRGDAIEVSFMVTQTPGGHDCQGNPSFPVEIRLSEPLGTRTLLDGSETPPRDATTEP